MFFNKEMENRTTLLKIELMLRVVIDHLGIDFDLYSEIKKTLNADVVEAIKKGNKIKAIKLYRNQTGVGLREAREMIELFESKV